MNLSIFLLFLIFFFQITSCFHWDGNILYDLETTTQTDFTTEASAWTLSSYVSTGVKFSTCGLNNYVMGGYNVLGGTSGQYIQRTYSSLPTHNQIYLQMKFYQIDSWDQDGGPINGYDYFVISLDGALITGWYLDSTYSGTYAVCGNPIQKDFVFTISLANPHSASSLTLKIITYTNQASTDESFGFRDIKIEFLTNSAPYFSLCAPGVSSLYLSASRCLTSCATSGNSIQPAGYGFCLPSSCSANCKKCSDTSATCTSCPTGSFLVGTTCYPTCNSPLTTKTLGDIVYCETPCPGQYFWWDSSCLSSCSYSTTYGSYPIVATTINTFQKCAYPCATNEYLYANASCLSSCPSPLITTTYKGRNFCEYPCTSLQYLSWNGSCLSTCPSPLTSEIQGTSPQRNFCWYTCSETQYLYWNGSCLSTCPSPLVSETQSTSQPRKFCWYPCAETEYLYWNGSCIATCPSPLSPEIQGTSKQRNFCWFKCSETQYLYWNGSCIDSCPSPLAPEIQSGVSSSRKFCWYLCQPSEYLFWNGSCINNCPSPLSSETQGTSQQRNFCWYTCQPSEFLYWNGSCINNCPSPLASEIQGTVDQRNFCWYSCQPNQYLYWNGSCLNTCPDPLTPEKQQGISSSRNFCWYTCQPSEYLFWNGSCTATCPSPLSPEIQGITQQRNFCWYTCQPSQYLYWNQSCSNNCPIPLVRFDLFCFLPCDMPNIYWYQDLSCRSECPSPYNLVFHDSVSRCLKPCSKSSEYYYDFEKECHNTCNPPYVRQIINTIKVCHIDASTLIKETNKIKSAAQVIETFGKVTSVILKAASVPQLSTPRSPLLIQLSSLIQYIRYMRIDYPWRVQLLFQSNDASLITLNIDFSIPNSIQDKFDNYPLPDVFEKYDLDSNFINNMWDLINTVLLVILVVCGLILLRPIFRKNFKVNRITARILQSLRWNVPLAMISGGAGEIIFYASLQIRNTPLDSAISITSFFISLIMIFWIIVILIICFKLLRGFRLQKRKITPAASSENQDWLDKWKGYEILYEEIEEKYIFSLAYMVIYVIRTILFFAVIANFYDYPLAQSILFNVMNFLIFIYLLSYKPLKDIWNTTQLFINEILGNILTICVLILAIMDKAEIEARHSRETIGNVMIVVMLIFYILGFVFLVIEGVLFCIGAYKIWKEMRARGIKNPLKMIQTLLFGEAKTQPKESTLELSQTSSRFNITTIHPEGNNYLVKPHTIDSAAKMSKIKSILVDDDIPLESSSRFMNPIGTQITESEIARAKMQSIELEIDTSRVNLQNESKREIESPPKEIPGFFLRDSYQPSGQPNTDFIQNWGNLKARIKRFNQSTHKVHWPSEE